MKIVFITDKKAEKTFNNSEGPDSTMNVTCDLPNVSNSSFYGNAFAGKKTRSNLMKEVYDLFSSEYH